MRWSFLWGSFGSKRRMWDIVRFVAITTIRPKNKAADWVVKAQLVRLSLGAGFQARLSLFWMYFVLKPVWDVLLPHLHEMKWSFFFRQKMKKTRIASRSEMRLAFWPWEFQKAPFFSEWAAIKMQAETEILANGRRISFHKEKTNMLESKNRKALTSPDCALQNLPHSRSARFHHQNSNL